MKGPRCECGAYCLPYAVRIGHSCKPKGGPRTVNLGAAGKITLQYQGNLCACGPAERRLIIAITDAVQEYETATSEKSSEVQTAKAAGGAR